MAPHIAPHPHLYIFGSDLSVVVNLPALAKKETVVVCEWRNKKKWELSLIDISNFRILSSDRVLLLEKLRKNDNEQMIAPYRNGQAEMQQPVIVSRFCFFV